MIIIKRTTEDIKNILLKYNYKLLSDYIDAKQKLKMENPDGYIVYGFVYEIEKGSVPAPFHKSNPATIYNINIYLNKRFNGKFTCISEQYTGKDDNLLFICNDCETIFKNKWNNINRKGETRNGLTCPNCGGRIESLHALTLKQVFLHEYSDTIVEDKTCINPLTNKIIPTDIVNHRLKIAIEIQSEWHDRENIKIKDKIKKDFWINKGYSFYDPDIRDYTILEMIQIFFKDINEIPEYINYNYSNKLNIKKIQNMLNNGMIVVDISKKLDINIHRIYDAIYNKKIKYPESYVPACYTKIVQLDLKENYLNTYNSINEAGEANNILPGNISSALSNGNNYSGGYFWVKYEDYISGNYKLESRFS